jgi:hypothetical protein
MHAGIPYGVSVLAGDVSRRAIVCPDRCGGLRDRPQSGELAETLRGFLHNKSGRHGHGFAHKSLNRGSHDGRLWATPNADFGVTFQFMLPVQT